MTIRQSLISVLRAAPGFYVDRFRVLAQAMDEQGKYVGWLESLHTDAERIGEGIGERAVSQAMALRRTMPWSQAIDRVRFELGLKGSA